MDITNENFVTMLPEIVETIQNCDFIAIDTELSGLLRSRCSNRFDLHEERFAKVVELSKGYFVLQFGLSCFKKCAYLHYSARTYNFYIFPQAHDEVGDIDRTFSLQAHAIQFLTQHGFDFNKLFKHGVSYLTFEEKKNLTSKSKGADKQKDQQQVDVSASAKGFLEILEQIIVNKKPIVGHNLILDLIHIINQFMEPVDEDYTSFKETCHSLFPLIYDTKYIAHSVIDPKTLTNNQSRLEDLYEQLRTPSETFTKLKVDQLGEAFDNSQGAHQAGYDAFMCGFCFLVMAYSYMQDDDHVATGDKVTRSSLVSIVTDPSLKDDFGNKIHFSFSHDLKYFNMAGDEENPFREYVFYVVHPDTWALEDIFQLFAAVGGVYASRVDKTSTLCALRTPKQEPNFLNRVKKLRDSGTNVYKIYTYEDYLDIKRRKRTCTK